jgi:hypothetical protein
MRSVLTRERTAPIVCDVDVDTSGTMPDETSETMTSETSSDATLVSVPTLQRGRRNCGPRPHTFGWTVCPVSEWF